MGAEVVITNRATGVAVQATSSKGGMYVSPPLAPGDYAVRVSATGFRTAVLRVTVAVGRTSTMDVRLPVGPAAETLTVTADEVRVEPARSGLEGLITGSLISNLPLNGRNFLDLGQLEPGVQLNADEWPTKTGYVRLSFAGQSGVTTRVTVDGLDASDESFGSVIANLSVDAIREFQVSRSNFDVATGLGGSGAVNVATRTGANELHGAGFFFWRQHRLAARIGPRAVPFDREQGGFSLGGPFQRDHLFWFVNFERSNQDAAVTTSFAQFPQFSGTWRVPYDESMALGRLDWNATGAVRLFSRFSFHHNDATDENGGVRLTPQAVRNRTNQTALGADVTNGVFSHSVRFGYTNYDSVSDVEMDRIPGFPVLTDTQGRWIRIGFAGGAGSIGPNTNAPVRRYQDNYEWRYDGAASFGRHSLRWGGLVNLIRVNWFSAINSLAPNFTLILNAATVAKCGSDLYCYPVQGANIGNGMGYWTELPSHGQRYGGIWNNRVHWYAGDNWRPHPRLNLHLGLRWVYEPGPNNTDLQKPAVFLNEFRPGLGAPNRRDRNNFAPQLGLVWNPDARHDWAVRAGIGVFYDTNLLKHTILERHILLPPGISSDNVNLLLRPARHPVTDAVAFSLAPFVSANCAGGPFPGRCQLGTPNFMETVWNGMLAFQAVYREAYESFPSGPTRAERSRGIAALGALYAPDYATPYSFHLNIGLQRQLRPGLVLSADYVRIRSLKHLLRQDLNRVGAADTLDVARALAAMNAVHASVRPTPCPQGPAGVNCAIAAGVKFATYVTRGLGADPSGATTTAANPSAFPGLKPAFNRMEQLQSGGISTYDALQVQLRGRLPSAGQFARDASIVTSYAWGRLEGTGFEDQALYNMADQVFNDDPRAFRGPADLDRTHMLIASGLFTTVGGVRLNTIWRAFSALPQSLFVAGTGAGNGELFYTDFNGDGFGPDPLPGTTRGDYGRRLGCGTAAINRVIEAYNSNQAGRLTPAGVALVNASLFTSAQLTTLGAVSPTVPLAPQGQLCLDSFVTTDLRASRPFRLSERVVIEPVLEWFNIFNVANFDQPGGKLNGTLSGTAGSLNGTAPGQNPFRAGNSAGSFALGAPRSWQLGVRVTF